MDARRTAIEGALRRQRLVAILRTTGEAPLDPVALALADAGVELVEITLTSPGAVETIARLRDRLPLVGAGSVVTAADARAVVEAGAAFVVTPGLVPDALAVAREAGLYTMPGTFTPTEMMAAHALGADAVKWFPASAGGPGLLREIRAALPAIPVVPTGGVSAANAADYLAAGAVAVGVGSALSRAADPAAAGRELLDLCATS